MQSPDCSWEHPVRNLASCAASRGRLLPGLAARSAVVDRHEQLAGPRADSRPPGTFRVAAEPFRVPYACWLSVIGACLSVLAPSQSVFVVFPVSRPRRPWPAASLDGIFGALPASSAPHPLWPPPLHSAPAGGSAGAAPRPECPLPAALPAISFRQAWAPTWVSRGRLCLFPSGQAGHVPLRAWFCPFTGLFKSVLGGFVVSLVVESQFPHEAVRSTRGGALPALWVVPCNLGPCHAESRLHKQSPNEGTRNRLGHALCTWFTG